MFIQIGENIYAKDSISVVRITNKTSVCVYVKNEDKIYPDSVNFKTHAEALEEMKRIYDILQKKA